MASPMLDSNAVVVGENDVAINRPNWAEASIMASEPIGRCHCRATDLDQNPPGWLSLSAVGVSLTGLVALVVLLSQSA